MKSWEQMTETERARVRLAARDLLEALEALLADRSNNAISPARQSARAAVAKARAAKLEEAMGVDHE